MLRIEAIGRLPLVDNIMKLCILLFCHLTMLGGVAGGRYPLTRSLEVCDSTMRLRIYFGGEEVGGLPRQAPITPTASAIGESHTCAYIF